MLRSISIQIIVFFIIFQSLSWFKESNMLATKSKLTKHHFVLPTTVGNTITLTPEKKTVIYFFAPWCHVCHASIDNLQSIYQRNEELNVIAVALDYMDVSEIEDFVAQHQLTFPVALGNEKVKQAYKVNGYPSYYVINEQNTVIAKSMGYSTELGLYLRSL